MSEFFVVVEIRFELVFLKRVDFECGVLVVLFCVLWGICFVMGFI